MGSQAITAAIGGPHRMETPPIVVDLINGVILRVGQDPGARAKYEELAAAQREAATSVGSSEPQSR